MYSGDWSSGKHELIRGASFSVAGGVQPAPLVAPPQIGPVSRNPLYGFGKRETYTPHIQFDPHLRAHLQ